MAGQIREMIDSIIEQRSKGNPLLRTTTTAKLALKGVDPHRFTSLSADDPEVIANLHRIADELGVTV